MISYLPEIHDHIINNLGKKVVCFVDYARYYTIDKKEGILVLDYEDSNFIEHFSIQDEGNKCIFPFSITDELSAITYVENVLVLIFRFKGG